MTELPNGHFETRAWRVGRSTLQVAEYVALHQAKAAASYRQGRIVAYRRDIKRPNKYVFVCEPEPDSLDWPSAISGGPAMAIHRG